MPAIFSHLQRIPCECRNSSHIVAAFSLTPEQRLFDNPYRYADRLISLVDTGAAKQYYHHDALGSTVNLTEESGDVRVSYQLYPWGHITAQSVNRYFNRAGA